MFIVEAFFFKSSACSARNTRRQCRRRNRSKTRSMASLAFCMVHGFLPSTMTDTILVPIIKDKTGNASSKANYRPIALKSVLSKVFETARTVI